MGGGAPTVQQAGLGQQHRAAADRGYPPGVRRSEVQPVHHRRALLLVHAASGDDNGVQRFARIQLRQTIVRQQVQTGLAVDHLVRLRGGDDNPVAGMRQPFRMQPVGLHQNVGDTGGFKQHAAVGNDNQDLLHVLKSTFNTV